MGDIADPPNTQKQIQTKNGETETKKYAPKKEHEKFPEKVLNEMEARKLLDACQNNGYKGDQEI